MLTANCEGRVSYTPRRKKTILEYPSDSLDSSSVADQVGCARLHATHMNHNLPWAAFDGKRQLASQPPGQALPFVHAHEILPLKLYKSGSAIPNPQPKPAGEKHPFRRSATHKSQDSWCPPNQPLKKLQNSWDACGYLPTCGWRMMRLERYGDVRCHLEWAYIVEIRFKSVVFTTLAAACLLED